MSLIEECRGLTPESPPDVVESILARILSAFHADPENLFLAAKVMRTCSQPAASASILRHAYKLTDTDQIVGALATVLMESNQPLDAAVVINDHLATTSENNRPLRRLQAECLRRAGHLHSAIALLESQLALKPDDAEAANNLAICHLAGGDFENAESILKRALSKHPGNARLSSNLGNLNLKRGYSSRALEAYRHALAIEPGLLEAHLGIIDVAEASGDLALFQQHLALALKLKPADPVLLFRYGVALHASDQLEPAARCLARVVSLQPANAQAYHHLGHVLGELRQLDTAVRMHQQAVELAPQSPAYLTALGRALRRLAPYEPASSELLTEAKRTFESALELAPDDNDLILELDSIYRAQCDWEGLKKVSARAVEAARHTGLRPLNLLANPDAKLADIQAAANTLASRAEASVSAFRETPYRLVKKATASPIRIAYLSSDFHAHATAYLIAGLIEHHDRRRFHISAFALGGDDGSEMRIRLHRAFDTFNTFPPHASPRTIADAIHADQTDILVDLKGHTMGSRPEILALRPAPIIVNFLGYPGTLGGKLADYIVGDSRVTPAEHAPYYSERFATMPYTYQPNDRSRQIGTIGNRASQNLPTNAFVFCCFNQHYKITEVVFDAWCRVLTRAPQSVLWLLHGNQTSDARLRQAAEDRGIEKERLIFAPKLPQTEHLGRLQHADLILDTSPYNAHTTASDALWVGVPVLTCIGQTFAARVAASLLTALGMPELITTTLSAYEDRAVNMATDRSDYDRVRSKVSQCRLTSPLFDTEGYTRAFESLLEQMWHRHDNKLPPCALDVPVRAQNDQYHPN